MALPETKSAFDLPELTHRFSRFVTVQDAISFALVSKAWTSHFISVIWFEIDFDVHPRFLNLSPEIVAKHGHLIRIIVNAKTLPQVSILANAGVNSLRNLRIETAASASQHVRAYEIVLRNNRSLEDLHLTAIYIVNKQDSTAHYVPVSALIPSLGSSPPTLSKLKKLKIANMCLTHDGLTFILQGCPRLVNLMLQYTDVVYTPTQYFQHVGVKFFAASLTSIFSAAPTGPSLLSYFPNLTTLSTYNYEGSPFTIPSARIKDDITRYCPHLSGYKLQDITGLIVPSFLTDIASNVSEVVYLHKTISSETITAMLLHQATLKSVKHFALDNGFEFEKDEVAKVVDQPEVSDRFLLLIPRCCPALEEWGLFSHELDMDDVEQGTWACQDLKKLRMRIKGLDTKEKILKAIALWRKGCWRRWQKHAGTSVAAEDEEDETDMSIEARVARHLLKFEKLWWVWLGYQTWTPI